MTLVSVIIPNYNYAPTLALCLGSVGRQTYPSIEVIVVDDVSTDGSVAVARSMGATVLSTGVNGGAPVARNLGAAHARGEILFFLDSDVALEPDAVAAAVRLLESDPGVGAVCGLYHPEPLVRDRLIKEYRAVQLHLWYYQREGRISGLHTALFAMRAAVYREMGPLDPQFRETDGGEYGRRLSQRYEVRASSAILGRHDHDPTMAAMLDKVFRRAWAAALDWRQGVVPAVSRARAMGSVLTLAAVLALPLAFGLAGAAAPVLLATAGMALDGRTYRYAYRTRGVPFGLYFTGVHLLVNAVSAAGAGLGMLRALRR